MMSAPSQHPVSTLSPNHVPTWCSTSSVVLSQLSSKHVQSAPSQKEYSLGLGNIPESVFLKFRSRSIPGFRTWVVNFDYLDVPGSNRVLHFLRFNSDIAVLSVFYTKMHFWCFWASVEPISTTVDLFLTTLAVTDANMVFVLQDSDLIFLYCSFRALNSSLRRFRALRTFSGCFIGHGSSSVSDGFRQRTRFRCLCEAFWRYFGRHILVQARHRFGLLKCLAFICLLPLVLWPWLLSHGLGVW